jgi:hypothetical protein
MFLRADSEAAILGHPSPKTLGRWLYQHGLQSDLQVAQWIYRECPGVSSDEMQDTLRAFRHARNPAATQAAVEKPLAVQFVTSDETYLPEYPERTITVASCHRNERAAQREATEKKRQIYRLHGPGRNPRTGDELKTVVENGIVYLVRPAGKKS